MAAATDPPRPRARRALPVLAGLAGVAGSTAATALAAQVAGRQADLALAPVEFAVRVGLLLAAPCVGGLLAAIAVPRGGGRAAALAIGLGVPVGPLVVLRLDRLASFGPWPALVIAVVELAWGATAAVLAAAWWARPSYQVHRVNLPAPGPSPPRDSELH